MTPHSPFARPASAADSLQRPPEVPDIIVPEVETDPWRSPISEVRLGEPGVAEAVEPAPEPPVASRFTLREALFQRRLTVGSLAVLAVGALVIGAVGAVAGVFLGSRATTIVADPSATLTVTKPAVEREVGSVAEIAARVLPAVVSIEVRVGQGGESGSGIIIDPAGYILTNNHVVVMATDDAAQLTVVFDDGTRVGARIIGRDPATDMAVIKVDSVAGLTVATLGDSDGLAVGDTVVAIGSPLGLSGTVTSGIVSAMHRAVRLGDGSSSDTAVIDAIQTDASINPGNSGGPLVDATGAVVGINTAIRTLSADPTTGGSIGLGFAMPINDARRIAETLIDHGQVDHATLGVAVRSATDGRTDGAIVQSVEANGPAAAAGIAEGDVITAVGDRAVRNADEFAVAVDRCGVGDRVEVAVLRDGRAMTVTATVTAR